MFASMLPVRLLFDVDSDPFETDAVGLNDMKMWARSTQNTAWGAIILGTSWATRHGKRTEKVRSHTAFARALIVT